MRRRSGTAGIRAPGCRSCADRGLAFGRFVSAEGRRPQARPSGALPAVRSAGAGLPPYQGPKEPPLALRGQNGGVARRPAVRGPGRPTGRGRRAVPPSPPPHNSVTQPGAAAARVPDSRSGPAYGDLSSYKPIQRPCAELCRGVGPRTATCRRTSTASVWPRTGCTGAMLGPRQGTGEACTTSCTPCGGLCTTAFPRGRQASKAAIRILLPTPLPPQAGAARAAAELGRGRPP